jgi:endonuclease/exonuclease/phosphatase family metal-dependent hydrolase
MRTSPLLVLLVCLCSTLALAASTPVLLETGAAAKHAPPPARGAPIRVVSYNVRYPGAEGVARIADALRADREIGGAAVVALQEIDRHKKRTGNVNTTRELAERLGMFYAWAGQPASPDDEEEDTGIALLSLFPITDVERIVLPHTGPGGRTRVALGATVAVAPEPIRVWVVHSERRIPLEQRIDQMRTVLDAVARGPHADRAIVLGDLNTYRIVEETEALFERAGFTTPIASDVPTLEVVFVKTKLDWIWLRGLCASGGGVARHLDLSDHSPVWVDLCGGRPADKPTAVRR